MITPPEENYEALLNGYYIATSFAIMLGVTLYGALAGTTGYAIFGSKGRNDWRNYLKWASIVGMVSNKKVDIKKALSGC